MAPGNTSDGAEQKRRVGDTFDLTAGTYDTVIPFFAHWGGRLVALAGLGAGERVLDVCCGTGASLFGAASAVGMSGEVVGVDIAPAMVRAAAESASRLEATNVTVHVGDAEALDFADGSFDAVLCGFGLMFLPDLGRGLAEMRRVLRAGGRFVASAPEADLPGVADVRRRWAERLPSEQVTAAPGPFEPSTAIEAAGFAAVESIEETADFTFDTGGAYVDWCRSHGARGFFEMFDEPDQRRLAEELAAAAEAEGGPDGIVMQTRARFWRAVATAAPG